MSTPKPFPDGHFYSPVVDAADAERARERIWPGDPRALGIDFNDASHELWLDEILPAYASDYEAYPADAAERVGFYRNNPTFSWLDARTLFAALRHFKPRRMVEIGSGMSSLLTADVNCRYLDRTLEFVCVEPHPEPYLVDGVAGITRLVKARVQDLPLETFDALAAGDVLFIDSSHVAKTGSDVNHIYFEILPRLARGVIVHVHDIFLPADYPRAWVVEQGRSWNEQYVVRALLMYSTGIEVVFGCAYAFYRHRERVRALLRGGLHGGGSLWLRKLADRTSLRQQVVISPGPTRND